MPFSDKNIRFTELLIAVVLLIVLGVVAHFGILVLVPEHREEIRPVISYIGIALSVLVVMIQQERAHREVHTQVENTSEEIAGDLKKTRHSIRNSAQIMKTGADLAKRTADKVGALEEATNGNLQRAIELASQQARQAERDQLLEDPVFMSRVATIFVQAAEPAIERAAKKAAEEACRAIMNQKKDA